MRAIAWGRAVAAACVCLAAAAAAQTPPARASLAQFRRNAAALAADAAALETVRRHEADRLHAGKPVSLLHVRLVRAVLGRDVEISLTRSPVLGTRGTMRAAMLNGDPYPVDAGALAFQGDGERGSAEGTFAVVLSRGMGWEGMVQDLFGPVDALTVDVWLNVRWEGGRLTGKYRFTPRELPAPEKGKAPPPAPLTATSGSAGGTCVAAAKLPAVAAPPAPPESLEKAYLAARRMEQGADRCYAEIRAMKLVRAGGMSYADALKAVTVLRMVRPSLGKKAAKRGKGGRRPGPAAPEPGGVGELGLESLGGAAAGEKTAGGPDLSDPAVRAAMEAAAAMAARVAQLRRVAQRYDAQAGAPTAEFIRDTLATCDPEFGPWYGEAALKVADGGANVLDADAGADGPQDWRFAAQWQALGPLPLTPLEPVTPLLPDVVLTGSEACTARLDELPGYTGADLLEWADCPGSRERRGFGYICPPKWFSFNPYYRGLPPILGYREYANQGHSGLPNSTAYLRCVIECPRDVELWAGLGVNRRGRLWLDDRLLWQGPSRVEPLRHEHVALLRLPLRKGANRLVLRLDSDFSSPYCWLRLCVRGRPRAAAEVKAKADAVAALRRGLKRDPAEGWRGDGTGHYEGASPPIAWDRKAAQNVLWHVPLPYFGNATPVPVPGTNRLLVTMEPCWLICLDKDSGRELWRRAVTLLDLLPPEERKKGWALHEAWWRARQARDAVRVADVRGMKHKAPKWLSYQWYWAEGTGIWAEGKTKSADERQGASGELLALLDKRDELEKAPDPTAVQDELNKVLQRIEAIQDKQFGSDPNSPQAKESRLRDAEADYVALLRRHSHVTGMGGGYWQDYTGWMFATPVTDGKHVWVKTGSDVAACFDLDGREVWKVQVWGSGVADHTLNSPRLVDGKLIMQLLNRNADPEDRGGRGVKLLALDAATGARLWETRDLADHAWNNSTPAVVTLTDGRDAMKVIVTTCGTALRADDGKVLVSNPGVQGGFASPLVDGDVVVFGAAALAPVQFIMTDRDHVGFRRLWAVRGGAHGLLDSGGAIVVDGRITHTVRINRDARRGGEGVSAVGLRAESGAGEGWRALEAYNLADGSYAGAIPILRKGGSQWTPASATDKYVYTILGDHIFQHIEPKAPMDMVVTTREAQPLRLANNAIDRTYGAGAIEGDRIYIRGYYGVTCVGYTGQAGRRYEARTIARNLLDDMFPQCPGGGELRDVPMRSESAVKDYPYGHPRCVYTAPRNCLLLSGRAAHRWWLVGPLPAGSGPAALAAFGGPDKPLRGDETFQLDGKQYAWGPLSQPFLAVRDFKPWRLDPANFTDIHRVRRAADLGKALGGRGGCTCFVMTELRSERAQVMRFEQPLAGARAWIGGVEVRHGDRVRFGEGVCQLLMQIDVGPLPAEGLWLSPRLWDSPDPAAERAAWLAREKRIRHWLEEVIRLAPDSPEALAAGRITGAH